MKGLSQETSQRAELGPDPPVPTTETKLWPLSPPMAMDRREKAVLGLYYLAVAGLVGRIAWLDDWGPGAWSLLVVLAATAGPDMVARPKMSSLARGVAFFAILCFAVTYLPDLWFSIAYALNHAKHYLWHANAAMAALPGNDASFIWSHRTPVLDRVMGFVYVTGFDMVVWIPVVRSLVAKDGLKVARYALAAHIVQFPMIIPFYAAFRVDEVWSVLGHPDRCERGWDDATRLNIGANCFPSMHTSVAFAILLLALREKSKPFRVLAPAYAVAIIFSTMYMEIHWVADVFAGLGLGWAAVKVVDWGLDRTRAALSSRNL